MSSSDFDIEASYDGNDDGAALRSYILMIHHNRVGAMYKNTSI